MTFITHGLTALQCQHKPPAFYITKKSNNRVINQINLRKLRFTPPKTGIIGKRAKTLSRPSFVTVRGVNWAGLILVAG
ncbi:hypothetical protein JK231_06760 [Pantoea sp. JGM49]|uniref:hypothetical protein n=1 Tax=unclassified Pantoea TaxID=2630326 RepID=UPI001BA5D2BB|nr:MULTISPECIES: hypothetical protein [unclassified Pantoea]MBS0880304.1 hypothetical protein [Pantoea sp. JGM49]